MSRRVRAQIRPLIAIVALVVLALATGGYILNEQRLRFPLLEAEPFRLHAEMETAQAVTPGQGQTIQVAGVRVGDIGRVRLRDGRAIVTMDLDAEFDDLVREDATALLRPRTGLKDMFIELDPGSSRAPVAREGFTIPVANTLPDVNPDEFFAELDVDTRDYLQQLVQGAGEGLRGRGDALREVFARFEPTHRDLARVNRSTARRHAALRRTVRSLRLLNQELAGSDEELSGLVSSSATVFRTFAAQDAELSEGVRLLPGALRDTRRALEQVRGFARELRPTARALQPPARRLAGAGDALTTLARTATPPLRAQIRPFAREARPLLRELRPAVRDVSAATPDLTRAGVVLNHFFNMVGLNPDGREGPEDAARQEGYLFWIAWLQHNSGALFASADAHGSFRPLAQTGTCATFQAVAEQLGQGDPLVGTILGGLDGVFTDPRVCGSSLDRDTRFAQRLRGGARDGG